MRFQLFPNLSIRRLFILINLYIFILLLGLVSLLLYINKEQKQLSKINERHHQSQDLLNYFRHSSDNLSKFARCYVVTHRNKFAKYYWNILGTLDGTQNMPSSLTDMYWDFAAWHGRMPRFTGKPDQITDLFTPELFTFEQRQLIQETYSHTMLVHSVERDAMDLIRKGLSEIKNEKGRLLKGIKRQDSLAMAQEADFGENLMLQSQQEIDGSMFMQEGVYSEMHLPNSGLFDEVNPDSLDQIGPPFLDAEQDEATMVEEARSINEDIEQKAEIVGQKYFDKAIELLFNEEYFRKKASLLTPLNDLLQDLNLEISEKVTIQKQKIHRLIIITDILFVLIFVMLLMSMLTLKNRIAVPIRTIKNKLAALSRGILPSISEEGFPENEIGEINLALTAHIDGLSKAVRFANTIGSDSAQQERFVPLSENDKLGTSLLEMQNRLNLADKEFQRIQQEEWQRKWASDGVAHINDVLREHSGNLTSLSYVIIRDLVERLGANQGGVFILNEEKSFDVHYELTASYAYGRRKFVGKKVLPKEGLIGAAAVERKTIYMTQLPDGYLEISSGLGKSNAGCLLLVPMTMEQKTIGVLEIASFEEIPPYKIEFVEQLANTLASSISVEKINKRTVVLLEQSKLKSEELASQEQEMRQNMEELLATQELAFRKEQETNNFLSAIDMIFVRCTMDLNGKVLVMNKRFASLLGLSSEQAATGKDLLALLKGPGQEKFSMLFERVTKELVPEREAIELDSPTGIVEMSSYLGVIYDNNHKPEKLLFLGSHR